MPYMYLSPGRVEKLIHQYDMICEADEKDDCTGSEPELVHSLQLHTRRWSCKGFDMEVFGDVVYFPGRCLKKGAKYDKKPYFEWNFVCDDVSAALDKLGATPYKKGWRAGSTLISVKENGLRVRAYSMRAKTFFLEICREDKKRKRV